MSRAHGSMEKKICFLLDLIIKRATYSTWSDPLVGYQIYGNKSSTTQRRDLRSGRMATYFNTDAPGRIKDIRMLKMRLR